MGICVACYWGRSKGPWYGLQTVQFSSAKLCCPVYLDELSVPGYSNAHDTNYRDDTELITVLDGFKYIGTWQICVSRMMQESAIFYGVCSICLSFMREASIHDEP